MYKTYPRRIPGIDILKTLVFIMTTFTYFSAEAQDFEGEIVYSIVHKSRWSQLSDTIPYAATGTEMRSLYKDGYLKTFFNGSGMEWTLFNPKDNTVSEKSFRSNEIRTRSSLSQPTVALSMERLPGKDIVMGYECDGTVFRLSGISVSYFSNKDLSLNPKHYKGFQIGYWDLMVSEMGAVPLKTVWETNDFISTMTAVRISRRTVLPEEVEIPKSQ